MAKVIFSMTAGVPHGDDYVQPTGDTPISLGEVEGKSYFSIDDGNTTIKTDGANDSVYGVSVVSDADEKAKVKSSSNYVKDGLEELDRKFMDNKSMVDLLADVADDTSATKTAIADHKAAKAAFLSNLGF
tara:strand:+ start:1370 stop:1759 length:390 start_codon:yes stop_codon:yes gene_type:complete